MNIFFTLLYKLIPLYIIIFLGFIAGKGLRVKKESIATLAIYIVVPVIIFNGIYTSPISTSTLSLPILVFCISCIICLFFLWLGKNVWKERVGNLLAFAAGDANTGYFGFPVAIALFPTHLVNLYIVAALGVVLYENTLGFFIAAKGHHTPLEALARLLKLPTLYAFFLGLMFNAAHIQLGPIYTDTVTNFKGAFTILGMMIIGLGLADIENFEFDFRFTGLAFLAKFFAWPTIMLSIFFIDTHFGHFYSKDLLKILFLISIVPMAANLVAFSTQLKLHPEKAAVAVVASTFFALFYIPFMVTLFIK